jgi:dipeptide/tripeptide permease
VQGQVQSIAIGLLLIFSILLPNIARQVSRRGIQLSRNTAVAAVVFIAAAGFFIWFFLWTRTLILAQ